LELFAPLDQRQVEFVKLEFGDLSESRFKRPLRKATGAASNEHDPSSPSLKATGLESFLRGRQGT
jgi:hypothetical protein